MERRSVDEMVACSLLAWYVTLTSGGGCWVVGGDAAGGCCCCCCCCMLHTAAANAYVLKEAKIM